MKLVSPSLRDRKSAPPGLRKLTNKHADQLVDLVCGGSKAFANTFKERVDDQNNGTDHHLVDDFTLDSVHDLLDTTIVDIIKTGYGQYHISDRHDHHMGGNCIVTCTVTFRTWLQISFCDQIINSHTTQPETA